VNGRAVKRCLLEEIASQNDQEAKGAGWKKKKRAEQEKLVWKETGNGL